MPYAPYARPIPDASVVPASAPASGPSSFPASAPATLPTTPAASAPAADAGLAHSDAGLAETAELITNVELAEEAGETADFIQELLSNHGLGLALGIGMLLTLMASRGWFKEPNLRRKLNAPMTWAVVYLAVHPLYLIWPDSVWLSFLSRVLLLIALISTAGLFFFDVVLVRWRGGREVPGIIRDLAQALLFISVMLVLLSGTGVDVSSLVVGSTVLTAVIGLALQDTLGNVIAGLAIQIEKPFEEGDSVTIGGTIGQLVGKVVAISWRTTKIKTRYEDLVIIPNKTVSNESLINHSKPQRLHRRKLVIGAPYDCPPNEVAAVLLAAAKSAETVLKEPGPEVNVIQYGDFTVDYQLRFSIENFQQRFECDDEVLRRVWYHFARAGIDFPFPVRDVRMQAITEERKKAARDTELEARQRLLQSIDFLSPLSEKERLTLCEHIDRKHFGAGEVIILQGDAGDSMYLIHRGKVDVRVATGAIAQSVATLGAGSLFGEMSLLTGAPRSATVLAIGDVVVYEIDKEDFERIFRQNEKLLEQISEALARRQMGLDEASKTEEEAAVSARVTKVDLLKRIKLFFRSK